MKTVISIAGGKGRLASKIVKLLPKHTIYVEPFFGGGAVFFQKGVPNVSNADHYKEVINDRDELLVNFFRVLRDSKKHLIDKINLTLFSRAEYDVARCVMKNPAGYSDLEKAWAFYVNIGMSFGGKESGGWRISKYARNDAKTFANKNTKLSAAMDRLQGVHIECDDALSVIDRLTAPQTVFYCDPPYINTKVGYRVPYGEEDYKRLIEKLDSIDGSFVLSGYNNEFVPEAWPKIELNAIMSCSKNRADNKRVECVWVVDRHSGAKTDLLRVMESLAWK